MGISNVIQWQLIVTLALTGSLVAEDQPSFDYQKLLERKYDCPFVFFKTIPAGPTTKVLWFDWIPSWDGGMNVIETNPDGSPLYWHDIPDPPMAAYLESVKMVELSGRKYLEVIGCTHMDNGSLSLYEIGRGIVSRRLHARVIANGQFQFQPRLANIRYVDLNQDSLLDVSIDAKILENQDKDDRIDTGTNYHREFLFEPEIFVEREEKRSGDKSLFN